MYIYIYMYVLQCIYTFKFVTPDSIIGPQSARLKRARALKARVCARL